MAEPRKGSLIAFAKVARDRVEAERQATRRDAPAQAGSDAAAGRRPAYRTGSEEMTTTAIHVPKATLALLRRVAVERANLHGGRPSVSALIADLVERNRAELEREVTG
jgi:hypothetical protein